MDDLYAINLAKTEFREAYNTGDPEALIERLDADAVYFADNRRMAIGSGVADAIRKQVDELWQQYEVHLVPIIIEIRIEGGIACEYGWHEWQFIPKGGGPPIARKDRYVDLWRKNKNGEWKLWTYMDNVDIPMEMPAVAG